MKAKLLLVEDEKNILITLKEVLELADYEVFTAENGKLGYQKIMDENPELVICDVNMPELDGFTLLKTINQKLEAEERPVFLFLTARVDSDEIRKGMNLGADDYILKPFEANDVLEAVALRLEKRHSTKKERKKHKADSQATQTEKLGIPSEDGIRFVPFSQIIRCAAERAYCRFFLQNGDSLLVSKPMKEFEERLLEHDFFKVHKSSIVNLQHVSKYVRGAGGSLELTDGSKVGVSTRRKEGLLAVLTER